MYKENLCSEETINIFVLPTDRPTAAPSSPSTIEAAETTRLAAASPDFSAGAFECERGEVSTRQEALNSVPDEEDIEETCASDRLPAEIRSNEAVDVVFAAASVECGGGDDSERDPRPT